MEILTQKATRRSTRVRVEIPVTVTSLDRRRPFAENCVLLVASAQGCGMRSPRALQLETPIMIGGLPGGNVTAWVANCVPLGSDGISFLIGAALYNPGNVWGVANPPEDWKVALQNVPVPAGQAGEPQLKVNRKSWPYNLFEDGAESHPRKK